MNNPIDLKNWQIEYGFASPKKKIKIYYTTKAFAKTIQLVKAHPDEVGWNMVIRPYKDGYKVYDVVVYPQKASSVFISVDTAKYGLWKATLDDDYERNLYGHGHSHVNMSPFATIIDENQQHDEIICKKRGFYFYQIWNKRNEINSFFYDIDNRIYYTNFDIEMIVEDVDSFVAESFKMVSWNRILPRYEEGEYFEPEQII